MRRLVWLLACTLPLLALLSVPPRAQEATTAITWKKTTLDRVFRSEGVAVADVNKDGKPDILVGDFWYEAPDWKRHQIRGNTDPKLVEQGLYGDGLRSYSDSLDG